MNVIVLTILILCAVGAVGSALYWYAFRFEPVNFKLSETDIFVTGKQETGQEQKIPGGKEASGPPDRDSGLKNKTGSDPVLTVLHLSDFHLRKDRKGGRLFQFIQGLKVLVPDLILITGDLVEKDEYFPYLIEMLSGFDAGLGKYAVFGVHDYYNKTIKEFTKNMIKRKKEYRRENDVSGLITKLGSIGIEVLRNKAVMLKLQDPATAGIKNTSDDHPGKQTVTVIDEVQVVGLEDAIIEKTDIDTAFKDLAAGAQKNNYHGDRNSDEAGKRKKDHFKQNMEKIHKLNNADRIRIIITHTPDMDIMAELATRDTDIILCGHTHGGQVRLPGIGALITGSKIKGRYASGLFYFKDFVLYTSRGLGEGRYSPFRFFCQPEASLIRIHNC